MKGFFLFFMLITVSNLQAQTTFPTPEQFGWEENILTDKELGEIRYYVTSNKSDQQKPVLLYLDGSGPYPLFQASERGMGSSVPLNYKSLSEKYHLVLISKPGVPFIDSVSNDPQTGYPVYEEPELYEEKLSLDWRVNSAKLVLKSMMKKYKTDKTKVAVMGISEGFQVGAKLASEDKTITHLMLFVGNGLSQFFDFTMQNRLDAQQGLITAEEAQINIDSINETVKEIYAHPTSTDKKWFGHTYLRWASFCTNNPTENILSLDIPVYIVSCANDRNTSVAGIDYMQLECIRNKKSKVEFVTYPYDHSFNEAVKNEKGEITGMNNHMMEVIEKGMEWWGQQIFGK